MNRLIYAVVAIFSIAATVPPGAVWTSFSNSSFEDSAPRENKFPQGWQSKTPDNTPDLFPGAWGLTLTPHHGKTCLGLVTRDDGGVENVGQSLPKPLQAGDCYAFSVYLAHADSYVGFNKPCRLRVWGGNAPGDKQVLLATSPLIAHSQWKAYTFQFTAPQNIQSITFEAYFAPGASFKYKGNILLDQCSDIEKCVKA